MERIGRCPCCFRSTRLAVGPVRNALMATGPVCGECQSEYGAKIAQLVGRARKDLDFARSCLAKMTPAAQQLFAEACDFSLSTRFALRLTPGPRKCADRRLYAVAEASSVNG